MLGCRNAFMYYQFSSVFLCQINKSSLQDSTAITQAQREVRDMLRILENQTHACLNESALNGLRRQLTELCSQFSMYLAGVPSPQFGPPSKKIRL